MVAHPLHIPMPPMSPSTPSGGRDADVAVLFANQQATAEALRDMSKAMTDGFASVNAKMDNINEIALNITHVQARQEAHSEGLSRAFSTIGALEKLLKDHHTEATERHLRALQQQEDKLSALAVSRERYQTEQAKLHETIEKRLNISRGAIWALAGVGSIVLSLLVWQAQMWIGDVRSHTEKIHQLQLDLSRVQPRN